MARTLIIFAKAPRLGQVKRRLAREIGQTNAWQFYRRTARHLVRSLSSDPRWQSHLIVTPDNFDGFGRFWPHASKVIKQGRGDLGERMRRAFCATPPGPAVLVGSDIPELAPCHIAEAFNALGCHDVVFGPAKDGGYWLVGLNMRARCINLFADVPWSTSRALSETRANLPKSYTVAMLGKLSDIDVGADFARWRERCRQMDAI